MCLSHRGPDSEKIFGLVPSYGGLGNCGLVDRSLAGLPNSRDGVLGRVARCELTQVLDISETWIIKMQNGKYKEGTYWVLANNTCYCAFRVIGETIKAKSVT